MSPPLCLYCSFHSFWETCFWVFQRNLQGYFSTPPKFSLRSWLHFLLFSMQVLLGFPIPVLYFVLSSTPDSTHSIFSKPQQKHKNVQSKFEVTRTVIGNSTMFTFFSISICLFFQRDSCMHFLPLSLSRCAHVFACSLSIAPLARYYLHEQRLKTYDNIKHSWFCRNIKMRKRLI